MNNKKDLYYYSCDLIKVIDGDTIYVLVDLGFKVYKKVILRLARIDSPELSTIEGKLAKQHLVDLFLSEDLNIRFTSTKLDAYGRSIAEIYLSTELSPLEYTLSDTIVDKGYGLYKNYKR